MQYAVTSIFIVFMKFLLVFFMLLCFQKFLLRVSYHSIFHFHVSRNKIYFYTFHIKFYKLIKNYVQFLLRIFLVFDLAGTIDTPTYFVTRHLETIYNLNLIATRIGAKLLVTRFEINSLYSFATRIGAAKTLRHTF